MSTVIVTSSEELERIVEDTVQGILQQTVPILLLRSNLPPYLSEAQLTEMTGWSKRKLAYMRQKKQIPFSQHGRKICYPTEAILSFLDENLTTTRQGSENRRLEEV